MVDNGGRSLSLKLWQIEVERTSRFPYKVNGLVRTGQQRETIEWTGPFGSEGLGVAC